MSQITIRNMDPLIEKIIREKAEDGHQSLSETVNQMLKQATGMDSTRGKKRNLNKLAGSWSQAEADGFEQTQKPFGRIDEELWK